MAKMTKKTGTIIAGAAGLLLTGGAFVLNALLGSEKHDDYATVPDYNEEEKPDENETETVEGEVE